MADEEFKETSILEDVFKGLDTFGSLSRQAIIENIRGTQTPNSFRDIAAGRKRTSARDLISEVEKQTGLDFTVGSSDPAQQTTTQQVANFGVELLTDIFTSPDSLIGAPAKIAKMHGVISNPKVVKAVTGATFGLLSAQPDDDLTEIIGKIGAGAAVGGLGTTLVKGGAKLVNKAGTKALNDFTERAFPDIFAGPNGIRAQVEKGMRKIGDISLAGKISTRFNSNSAKHQAFFTRLMTDNVDKIIKESRDAGLSEADALKNVESFRETLATGQSSMIGRRNEILKEIAEKEEVEALSGGVGAGAKANLQEATRRANVETFNETVAKMDENPIVLDAINKHKDSNEKLVERYNRAITQRVDKLTKQGKTAKALKEEQKTFYPPWLHTVDLRKVDDAADAQMKVGLVSTGAKLRKSDIIDAGLDIPVKDSIALGAQRYANLFANQAEVESRQLLSLVYGAKGERPILEMWADKTVPLERKILAGLDVYDNFINLIKTKHLASGLSWPMTNYTDNVIKAFVHASPESSLKVAAKTAGQLPLALADRAGPVGRFVGDALTFGNLERLNKKNTLLKLMKSFDPTDSVTKIDYKDDWMNAIARFGGIESNRFVDAFQLARQSQGILAVKHGKEGADRIVQQLSDRGAVTNMFDRTQRFFWEKVGSVGGAMEGNARYIVFKDTAESMMKDFPALDNAVKQGRLGKLLEETRPLADLPKVKRLEVEQLNHVFKKASKITNDIFFDYQHVTEFEKHVMKRIFPYWTFFSRNFQQWLDAGFDPNKIGKISKTLKPIQNIGRPLSEEERQKTPNYLLEKGLRVVGQDGGDIEFAYSPNMSMFDAINSIQDIGGETLSKLSPPIRAFGEAFLNREAFGRDVPAFPTEDQPKKRVLESGLTALPDEILESFNLFRDDKGRLFTNSKTTAGALKILSDLTPAPLQLQFADQFARAKRDVLFKEKSKLEALQNFFPILRTTDLVAEDAKRTQEVFKRNIKKLEGGKEELLSTGRSSSRRKRRRRRIRRRKR